MTNLTSKKPDTLDAALEIVRNHVDQAYRRSLKAMRQTASGIPSIKPQQQQAAEAEVLDALLVLLSDLDPRYSAGPSRIKAESFVRIGGVQIVDRDRNDQHEYMAAGKRKVAPR